MVLVSGASIASVFYKGPSPLCSVWKQFGKQEMLILCPENKETSQKEIALGQHDGVRWACQDNTRRLETSEQTQETPRR